MCENNHSLRVCIMSSIHDIRSRTYTSPSHGITALSFSHDGEFIAIANQGTYIDIVRSFITFFTCLIIHYGFTHSAQQRLAYPCTAYPHWVRHRLCNGTRRNGSSHTAAKAKLAPRSRHGYLCSVQACLHEVRGRGCEVIAYHSDIDSHRSTTYVLEYIRWS